jgi:hypothetical protein
MLTNEELRKIREETEDPDAYRDNWLGVLVRVCLQLEETQTELTRLREQRRAIGQWLATWEPEPPAADELPEGWRDWATANPPTE